MTHFSDLGLRKEIVQALEKASITIPTPIQSEAIPLAIKKQDIVGTAHTGTGKTLAFLLPVVQNLLDHECDRVAPRVLILVPTRELAEQVSKEALNLCQALGQLKTVCVYGGVPYPKQTRQLSKKYDILVATPGRLIDHINRKRIDLSLVETLILDEADRMLDMGFVDPVEEIAAKTPSTRQTLLFSATLTKGVKKISQRFQKNPSYIAVESENKAHSLISQRLFFTDDYDHKVRILEKLLNEESLTQAIVFSSTKIGTEKLAKILKDKGLQAAPIHGDFRQHQRHRVIKSFKMKKLQILVATDVAARGLDVPDISHVFNFDLPQSPEDFVHRIGRTGRAGATGMAISFVRRSETRAFSQIENLTGKKVKPEIIPGLEPKLNFSFKEKRKGPPRSQPFKRRGAKPPFAKKKAPFSRGRKKARPFAARP